MTTDTPIWPAVDSVKTPDQLPTGDVSAVHPFDAPSRWQVAVLVAGLVTVLFLAALGFWQSAVWVLVVLLLVMTVFRLRYRRAWTRARSRLFDVTVLLGLAVCLVVVMVLLPA